MTWRAPNGTTGLAFAGDLRPGSQSCQVPHFHPSRSSRKVRCGRLLRKSSRRRRILNQRHSLIRSLMLADNSTLGALAGPPPFALGRDRVCSGHGRFDLSIGRNGIRRCGSRCRPFLRSRLNGNERRRRCHAPRLGRPHLDVIAEPRQSSHQPRRHLRLITAIVLIPS
jgi:hypothetical protein